MTVQNELENARRFGEQLEELVVRKGGCPDDDRNILLLGYWALLFDFHKGILDLIANDICGSAFALLRPLLEALVRAHLAVRGSADDLERLQQDDYRTNFVTVGPWIDREFDTGNLFTKFLEDARLALHSFTHAGISQLGRRFEGHSLTPTYREAEVVEVIHVTTSAVWMVTNLVTTQLGFNEEANRAGELFLQWSKH